MKGRTFRSHSAIIYLPPIESDKVFACVASKTLTGFGFSKGTKALLDRTCTGQGPLIFPLSINCIDVCVLYRSPPHNKSLRQIHTHLHSRRLVQTHFRKKEEKRLEEMQKNNDQGGKYLIRLFQEHELKRNTEFHKSTLISQRTKTKTAEINK